MGTIADSLTQDRLIRLPPLLLARWHLFLLLMALMDEKLEEQQKQEFAPTLTKVTLRPALRASFFTTPNQLLVDLLVEQLVEQ